MMSCPECNKRASEEKKALSECKGNCEKLNVKAQRLSMVVAVLGTVLGKETLDMALGLESSLTQLAASTPEFPTTVASSSTPSFTPSNPKAPKSKDSGPSYLSNSVNLEDSVLSVVPPLTTVNSPFPGNSMFDLNFVGPDESQLIVPFRNGMLLFGLAFIGYQKRHRDG